MKKIVSLIIALLLVFTVAGCSLKETIKTEEELKAEIEAEQRIKEELKEELERIKQEQEKNNPLKDIEAVIEFVNTTDMNVSDIQITDDYEVQYFDFTGEGNEDICIVNGLVDGMLTPVAFVTLDVHEGEYYLINTTMHGQKGDEFYYEKGFVVKKLQDYNNDDVSRIDIYFNFGNELIKNVCDWNIPSGTGVYVEDIKLGTKVISEDSITKKDGLRNFVWQSNSFYVDELGDKYPLEDITREFTFNEDNEFIDMVETDNSAYHTVTELRKTIDYYGDNTKLKTFDTVYNEGDLLWALKYYSDNRYDFTKKAKEKYVYDILDKIGSMNTYNGMELDFRLQEEIVDDKIKVTIDKNKIDEYTLHNINQDEKLRSVFKLAKVYYAMTGDINDYGYVMGIVDVDISNLVHTIYMDWLLFEEGEDVYYYSSNNTYYADIEFSNIEEVINYQSVYPTVVINNLSQIEELKHKDVWKTTVLLPVTVKYIN